MIGAPTVAAASAPARFEHGLIVTDAALEALRPEWEALWTRLPDASPFQHPAWLLAWWRQFGTAEPRAAWMRDAAGQLIGVLPLYVLAEGGAGGRRKLLPIGAGLTDYQDMLVEPQAAAPLAASGLVAALDEGGGSMPRPDLADLICLPPGSALRGAAPPAGWRAELVAADPCPVLDLSCPVPARQRRKLRMNQHRADRIGGWTVEQATAETFEALWHELERLHQARWIASGEAGVLADPRVPAFLRDAAGWMLPAGLARLYAVRLRGRIAAACLVLVARDALLLYLSGYDAAFAHESPGTLLLGHMLEEASREGRREVHFLRGGEAYKYAWGASDRHNATLHLRPATTLG